MSELNVFRGLHEALAHLCLRDGRARKDIAMAAKLNPSMLSGYCSGRLVPSIEHLDRLLSTLGCDLDALVNEMEGTSGRARRPQPVPRPAEGRSGAAEAMLITLLGEIRKMIEADINDMMVEAQQAGLRRADAVLRGDSQPAPARRPSPERAGRRRGRGKETQ